jgi:UDP-2,4-diacetamido-2,4,6-trideoxy-beta-L-altropyranose hydrolase
MKAAFRVDASVQTGAGHVMRCLALAEELRSQGAATCFICRPQEGGLHEAIEARGHAAILLPPSVAGWEDDAAATAQRLAQGAPWDWLVCDHYGLDARWEARQRPWAKRILAIDDLAERAHDCDLLLDQNLKPESAYAGLVPPGCTVFVGPHYALLRPEFRQTRLALRPYRATAERLLILFGGTDPLNLTGLALDALDRLDTGDWSVDAVVGSSHPHKAALEARCAQRPNTRLHVQAGHVAELMGAADLAIGASGISTWERACLGLPSLVITFADNQRPIAAAAQEAGLLTWLGDAGEVDAAGLAQEIATLSRHPERRLAQRQACLDRVDGKGCARLAEAMRP